MSKLTNLLKAIRLAKVPGVCKYLNKAGDGPQCVIGQLAFLEGYSLKELKKWDRTKDDSGIDNILEKNPDLTLKEKYGKSFLTKLQYMWDTGIDVSKEKPKTVALLKKQMREFVEKKYKGK